jgi:hypothetical protein
MIPRDLFVNINEFQGQPRLPLHEYDEDES